MSLSDLLAKAILSTRSDAIVAADRESIIRFWNPGAERLFGYSRDEAIARPLDLIIPARLRQLHSEGYRRVMETGESRYSEGDVLSVPAVRKDGATISVEFTVVPLLDDGQTIGMAAIMRDVTKRFDEMRALKRKLAEVASTSTKKP